MINDLKTMVHVESRSRFWSARNISATPASPAWVAIRMCSTYLALGAASFIFVPPFTDFSKLPDMMTIGVYEMWICDSTETTVDGESCHLLQWSC